MIIKIYYQNGKMKKSFFYSFYDESITLISKPDRYNINYTDSLINIDRNIINKILPERIKQS